MTMKFKAAIPLFAAATLVLTACEEGQFLTAPASQDSASATTATAQARTEIREVERADIFSAEELALWDGRPSLGGLWVAHPDVGDPERVRITNNTNGQSVLGALFRRERANPGPRIQLSSDAAGALGILAGQPTELNIVVIRQEEITIEPAPIPVEEPAEDEATDETVAASLGDATVDAPAEPPKRQGFFARLFGGGAAEEASDEPESIEGAAAPEVQTETLDPITTSAAAAIDAADASSAALSANARPQRRAVAAASTAAVATAPAPAAPAPAAPPAVTPEPVRTPAPSQPAATPPSLNNPYVQVGLFTVEANASAAATGLRQGGIVPTIVPGTNASGTFWRVLVGPMTNPDDQTEILSQVKALGYSDAFLVSN